MAEVGSGQLIMNITTPPVSQDGSGVVTSVPADNVVTTTGTPALRVEHYSDYNNDPNDSYTGQFFVTQKGHYDIFVNVARFPTDVKYNEFFITVELDGAVRSSASFTRDGDNYGQNVPIITNTEFFVNNRLRLRAYYEYKSTSAPDTKKSPLDSNLPVIFTFVRLTG